MFIQRLLLSVMLVTILATARPLWSEGYVPSVSQGTCSDTNRLIRELHSKNSQKRSKARKELLESATHSGDCRRTVVYALIALIEEAGTTESRFPDWTFHDAADVIGKMKATEAINVLVRFLDFNDGTVGFSLTHVPAVRAIVRIGEPAVPMLSEALSWGKPSIRANAARALGLIASSAAKDALEQALTKETNMEVRGHLEIALKNHIQKPNGRL